MAATTAPIKAQNEAWQRILSAKDRTAAPAGQKAWIKPVLVLGGIGLLFMLLRRGL